jgi:tetratricopeptide (TPR) repeat protein
VECLTENALLEISGGSLDPQRRSELDQHLDSCPSCRRLYAEWLCSESDAEPRVATGTLIGRYLVLDCLGAGAMGIVYSAFDPQLDRKVCLKLLHSGGRGAEGSDRLVREAKALAKLSHPNVVTVYEVGTVGERVFIAMELVEGNNLSEWLRTQGRSWRDVVRVLADGGRGLAAAHAAGLAHRDFKPENMLVGADGRARVTDFGLARALESASAATAVPASPSARSALAGTPVYMAPEQFRGSPAGPGTDQYSFCVTLFEALNGARPAPDPLRWKAEIPARVRRVVARGLSEDPAARFPSLDALLVGLERAARPAARRTLALAALALAAAAGVVLLVRDAARRAAVCSGGPAQLAAAWSSDSEHAVHAAFAATGVPHAESAWGATRLALDAYGQAWVAGYEDACRATRIRREQPEGVMNARMACLSRRLKGVSALAAVLAHADAEAVDHAAVAASSLPPVTSCSQVDVMASRVAPPAPALAARVDALRGDIARARALYDVAQYSQGFPVAERAAAQAAQVPYLLVQAEALFQRGRLEQMLGRDPAADATLREAATLAYGAGDDELAAWAWLTRIAVVGHELRRPDDAVEDSKLAEQAIERLGGQEALAAELRLTQARIALDKGQLAEGAELTRQGLGRLEHLHGTHHVALKRALALTTEVEFKQGHFQETLHAAERLRDIAQDPASPDPRQLAFAFQWMANAQSSLGNDEAALADQARVVELDEKTFGTHHPAYAVDLHNEGTILLEVGKAAEALDAFQRAYAIKASLLPPDHPVLAGSLEGISAALGTLGRYREAEEPLRKAIAIDAKQGGPDSDEVLGDQVNLGSLLEKEGRARDALALLRPVVAKQEKAMGHDNEQRAEGLRVLGETELTLGMPSAAQTLAEAVRLCESAGVNAADRGKTRFLLAKALWRSPATRAKAKALATQAADELGRTGERGRSDRESLHQWLATVAR